MCSSPQPTWTRSKTAEIQALSKAFGNFDRTVGLGWLIGYAVGLPLVDRKAAHATGLKAAREVGKIKAGVRAAQLNAQRATCKLAADDPQRQQLAEDAVDAVEAEAAILRAAVDVALPEAPPAARRAPPGS